MPKKKLFAVLSFLSSFLIAFFILELFFLLAMRYPQPLRRVPKLFSHIRYLYNHHTRINTHYNPACAEYHPNLTYTLKPGNCVFQGMEFSNRFEINNMGLRDDEESLIGPEIIVLGDSFAMGWGVEQNEAFPQVLEAQTGMKTLNAGVSSYSTVKEIKLLNQLDTSAVKYVVIQYCANDAISNLIFAKQKGRWLTPPKEYYEKRVVAHHRTIHYTFGKLTFLSVKKLLNDLTERGNKKPAESPETEAAVFYYALARGTLKNAVLIILELNPYCKNDGKFVSKLEEQLEDFQSHGLFKDIKILHSEDFIQRKAHCYLLDSHLNKQGHQAVARAIHDVIMQIESENDSTKPNH